MGSAIVYEDRWGDVIDRPDVDLIEIRWHNTTRELDKQSFEDWLTVFAGHVEATARSNILTDATAFGMPVEYMDGDWRDEHIIPRYNESGVRKFAFLMPDGMPAIGAEPSLEGPAEYPTAYFGRREEALAWLESD